MHPSLKDQLSQVSFDTNTALIHRQRKLLYMGSLWLDFAVILYSVNLCP